MNPSSSFSKARSNPSARAAEQWLGNRGIFVPCATYSRAMVVSGVVVAECRDRRRTWAVFAGDIIADIYAEVVVPARTTVRRFLERELATLFSKPGTPDRELLTLNLTNESYDRLLALDHSLVGTDDYMGLAYFWHHEYRHTLRDCTHVSRARVHDELRAAGLPLDGCSANHGKIIRRFAEMDE